jgi:VWFA-related protein
MRATVAHALWGLGIVCVGTCVTVLAFSDVPASSADQQLFRSNVDGVAIPVTVKTGGKFVSGLKASDFEVRDNGVVQKVEALDANAVPLDLSILLDTSTSVDGPLLQQLKFAVVDTAAQMHDTDRLRLIAVSQVLQEILPWRSRHDAMPLDSLGAEGGTSLYDALVAGMIRRADPGRRQLVIAFTDGRDSTSILDEAETSHIARLTDTVVDLVMPLTKDEKPPDRPVTNSLRQQTLDTQLFTGSNVANGTPAELAARAREMKPWEVKEALVAALDGLISPTAGKVFTFEAGQSVGRQFRRVLDDYRSGYVLEYAPQGVPAEGWHEITVTVVKPGKYDVRARKGYQNDVKIMREGSR